MSQTEQITLYTYDDSPYAYRVLLALEEAQATYTSCRVNLFDKPEWYVVKVNPAGKVPALTYGGSKASPEEPSPGSIKLNESLVIVEFIADLFPGSSLLPKDPVLRARARLFIAAIESTFIDAFRKVFFEGESPNKLVSALEHIQSRLPDTGFAVGEWSIGDVASAPFLALMLVMLENDIGKYPSGAGNVALEALRSPKFTRLMKYVADIRDRPSFKSTWDRNVWLAGWKSFPPVNRALT